MEKIRQEKIEDKFRDVCKKCGKKVVGFTEGEVKANLGRHEGSLACKEQQKRNQKLEKKQ